MKYSVIFGISLICFIAGCKSNTSANSSSSTSGASGTILFGSAAVVSTTQVGSDVANSLFAGYDPSNTPDGKILYFTRGETSPDDNEHIYVASPNGTEVQSLVNMNASSPSGHPHPRISKDGKYLVFNYYEATEQSLGPTYGTLIDHADGSSYLVASNVWDADWTPNGDLIAAGTLNSDDGQYTFGSPGLFRYSNNFQTVTTIGSGLTDPQQPAVSPDGQTIAFVMSEHIWTIKMDGTSLTQITDGASQQTHPCWSPDGKYIASVSNGSGALISSFGMIIVPSNPASPSVISSSTNFWVLDKNNSDVPMAADDGNIEWR